MEKKRLCNLDILKIVSATFIVFHHYQQVSGASFNGFNFYGGKISWGYLVELFFMISGFLAAMTIKCNDKISKSLLKKVSRIMPMAFLSVLSYLIILVLYKAFTGKLLFNESYSVIQVITSLTLLNQGWLVEFFPAINNPIWYLCVLVWISILYIVIKYIVKDNNKAELFISFLFVVLGIVGWRINGKYGFDLPFLHTSDCRGYVAFFIGVCLYHLFCKLGERNTSIVGAGLVVVSLIGMCILGYSNWYVLVVFLFPSILLLAVSIPQICIPNIELCGGVSYEVYLWHMPMFCLIKMVVDVIGLQIEHSYFTMGLFCALVWSIAFILYQFVETPINKKLSHLLRI